MERGAEKVLSSLRQSVNCYQTGWDRHIPPFLVTSSMPEITGQKPASTIFGRELRFPADLIFGHPPDQPMKTEDYI